MKKVLFVLSGNLSTTPRALKIIESFKDNYDIDILAINRSKTWEKLDYEYQEDLHLNLKLIDITRQNILSWLIAGVVHKLSRYVYKFNKKNKWINAFASEKASIFLWIALDNYSENYDLVASFSYGSIFPAVEFASRNNFPVIVDIEDFHPGENIALKRKREKARREFILNHSLPQCAFFTYASPLIGLYTINTISKNKVPSNKLINNSFSQKEFVYKQNLSEKIKFVWFSQTIAYERGLELIIPALAEYRNDVELHLIGNINRKFEQNIIQPNKSFITLLEPLSQIDLNSKLAEFDIGLAIETSENDANREICLTNKIFAYAQAGLYVLATNTQAQNIFINEHKDLGQTVRYEQNDMRNKLNYIIENINDIRTLKAKRFQYSKALAWDEEQKKISQIWTNIMNK
jgi:hypothetical protein